MACLMAIQIALRIEDELLAEIDALVPLLSTPWRKMTRSDVLRAAVIMGLPSLRDQARAMASAFARSAAPPNAAVVEAAGLLDTETEIPTGLIRRPDARGPGMDDESPTISMTADEVRDKLRDIHPSEVYDHEVEIAIHDFAPHGGRPSTRAKGAKASALAQGGPAGGLSDLEHPTETTAIEVPSPSPQASRSPEPKRLRARLSAGMERNTVKMKDVAEEIEVSRPQLQAFRAGGKIAQDKLRALDAALRRRGV